jgi:hypothetical protein
VVENGGPSVVLQLWFLLVNRDPCVVPQERMCGRESKSVRGTRALAVC